MLVPVILSGGHGSRLWPLSRASYPKQLLALAGEKTLLQETCLRTEHIAEAGAPIFVCNQEHRFMVAEQLAEINTIAASILLEPMAKNTAAAVALAALQAMQIDEDPLLLVMPADHIVLDTSAFYQAVLRAKEQAQTGDLITFGITATEPKTSYGYIKSGKKVHTDVFKVDQFVEKPAKDVAEKFIADGGYFWNSGMFLFKASSFLTEMERHAPKILQVCRETLAYSTKIEQFIELDRDTFIQCPEDSIDYAVMEKTEKVLVTPMDAGWSDIGYWSSLLEVEPTDEQGNILKGDVIVEGVSDSYVRSHDRLIAAVGVEDTIIVETADAVLVTKRDHCQDVKKIVSRLRAESRHEATTHVRNYRPWGWYEQLSHGPGFQVKRIHVHSGASLSMQLHYHRSEHWVVVSGTAKVHADEKEYLLSENESTYIPLGVKHRLSNVGKIPLQVIEVQSGRYLGEDDIVRFEDVYGRVAQDEASDNLVIQGSQEKVMI